MTDVDMGMIVQALTEHHHLKHHTTIEGFTTCRCSCGILTECAGPMGWFACDKGHAEHLARDILMPLMTRPIPPGSRCTCGAGDHRPPGVHNIHCADPDASATRPIPAR
jgi:hypothetical protein